MFKLNNCPRATCWKPQLSGCLLQLWNRNVPSQISKFCSQIFRQLADWETLIQPEEERSLAHFFKIRFIDQLSCHWKLFHFCASFWISWLAHEESGTNPKNSFTWSPSLWLPWRCFCFLCEVGFGCSLCQSKWVSVTAASSFPGLSCR